MKEFPSGLAKHFRQHNQRAFFLAIGCLLGAIVSWLAVYGALVWAELLFVTTIHGIDAPPTVSVLPHFLVVVVASFIISSLVRKWKTQNEKFHPGVALFSLISIPARFTYAVWNNFQARVYPSEEELASAWQVLEMLRAQKKIAVTNLPVLLTSDADAGRIAYLLAITGLLDTDAYSGVYYHHLRNQEAERLVRRWDESLMLAN